MRLRTPFFECSQQKWTPSVVCTVTENFPILVCHKDYLLVVNLVFRPYEPVGLIILQSRELKSCTSQSEEAEQSGGTKTIIITPEVLARNTCVCVCVCPPRAGEG